MASRRSMSSSSAPCLAMASPSFSPGFDSFVVASCRSRGRRQTPWEEVFGPDLALEDDQAAAAGAGEEDKEEIQYPFFTEGTQELLKARVDIAQYSLPRAKARIERVKRRHDDPDEDPEAGADLVVKQAGEFVLECSEIGDDRPLSGCSFSRDASMLATSSWSGMIKIWSMPQITKVATLKGHTERATDVAFSPADDCLATASADKTAKLWKPDGSLLMSFDGHLDRLARVAFHPSGKYLGTASFDKTWRLWDTSLDISGGFFLRQGSAVSFHGSPESSIRAHTSLISIRFYKENHSNIRPHNSASAAPNTFKKKAPNAIKEIRKFARKAMGATDVRVDVKLNKHIWSSGIRSVPRRVRVRIARRRNDEEDTKEELYSLVTVAEIPSEGLKGLGTKVVDEAD